MNGVVMLVAVLVTLVALKQIIDRDWMGLLLTVVALLLVFGTAFGEADQNHLSHGS